MRSAEHHTQHRGWSRRTVAVAAMLCVAAYAGLDRWGRTHLFLINATTSLPNWAFIVDRSIKPTRGRLVFFAAPESGLVARHFGAQPAPFGKIVYGIGGDRVERRGRTFLVNGTAVATAKQRSSLGEPLTPGPVGTLPRGCMFVATPHPDGFDSRYAAIGWICRDRVLGVGEAIL